VAAPRRPPTICHHLRKVEKRGKSTIENREEDKRREKNEWWRMEKEEIKAKEGAGWVASLGV
jgi:hypothetical protein